MASCVRPHRRQPTRLPRPWDSPGKNTGVGCHFLLQCMKVKSQSEVTQSCPTLSDLMDCSLPDSSVHGIFQARVLEWGAIAFSNNHYTNLAETFAYNNAVRYNTPTWGGLTLGAEYGFNSAPAGAPTNRNTSVGVNYLQGPLRVAAAWSEQNNRTLRGFAPFAAATGLPATGAMSKVTNAGIGATYRFTSFGVNAAYSQSKLEAGTVSATMRNLDLGLAYHLTPATTLNAGYTRSKLVSSSWNTYSLMLMYGFSKRTQAYVQGTFQQASQGQLALLNGVGGPSSDSHQNIVGIGMHHSF